MNVQIIPLSSGLSEYGFMATMDAYILEQNDADGPRPMVIVFPGGGYSFVAENWEGERIALSYTAAGYCAAVVNYSVAPHRYPQPILDAAQAIRICRENADRWQIDASKIIVCGFSAGGHLAAAISNLWNDNTIFSDADIKSRIFRPNGSILCYPVITSGENAHYDSFACLLGPGVEETDLWEAMSLEKRVTWDTPPTFLWHTWEDSAVPVENSMLYASALRKSDVPFELHIYPKGGHGTSLTTRGLPRTKSVFDRDYGWMKLSVDWIAELFCKEVSL